MSATSSSKEQAVDKTVIGLAAAMRAMSLRKEQTQYMPFDEEWRLRQNFRRRIDRDILEGNNPKVSIESLKTVLRLARNILAHPTDEKYRRFKTTNRHIKSKIMEPNGVLQLIMDLGFRIKAENFESVCVYNSKMYNALRVGSTIMEEILEREVKKQEDEERRQEREKAESEAHKQKLKAQFLDDRQSVHARVQRERHLPLEKGLPALKGGPRKTEIATVHGRS